MICLYEKDATEADWADVLSDGTANPDKNNGLCVLSPTVCEVKETAGGQYELEMEHPLDDHHKYLMLTEERLIKAPVPKTVIPAIQMPALMAWRVTNAEGTKLYSKTPSTTYKNKNWKTIKMVRDSANPAAYAYNPNKYYNYMAVVLESNSVYQCCRACMGMPVTDTFYWTFLGTLNDAAPTYDAGTVLETLAYNATVYKIANKGEWMQARAVSGNTGFVIRADCAYVEDRPAETLPAQTITEQMFRIYETACDEETNTYTVKAKHISYDFMGNSLYDCAVTEATPAEAIAAIQGSLAYDDNRRIACNITGETITQDWSFKNPVSALLDPDSGMVGKLNARLIRNNRDFYLLNAANPRAGITISYGVNMLGVNWKRSVENVVTRIIPRSGSSEKGYTYLSDGGKIQWDDQNSRWTIQNQGKDYVESPIAGDYQVPRVQVMDCSYEAGQEYEASDGTKQTYTAAEVLEKMRCEAMEKFIRDKIDGVDIQLDVEFLLLGDTEEYRQYRGLQWVSLYDVIKVRTGKSGIDAEAQVTETVYDSLRKRYISVKLGTVNSFNKRIAGYRFINGSITYDKLSPDLINRIVTGNASSSTGSGSAGDQPGGGGETTRTNVIDSLTSTSTTDALSANQGRVLKGMLAAEEVTATAGTNITINWQRCRKVLEIAVAEAAFTTGAAIAAGDTVLTGLPNIGGNQQHFVAINDAGGLVPLSITGGSVTALTGIANGAKVRFILAYFYV